MKLLIFSLTLLALSSPVNASVDLDVQYSCQVTESNNASVPKGSKTYGSFVLRHFASNGMINLRKDNTPTSIFLYGKLEILEAYAQNSGAVVLATDLKDLKEFYGSVSVTEKNPRQLELSILIQRAVNAFRSDGTVARILVEGPEIYKMICTAL